MGNKKEGQMDKLIAKVNGREIHESDIERLYRSAGPQEAKHYEGEAGKAKILNELIYQELFYSDAVERKLDESEEFKNKMEEARKSILTQMNINSAINGLEVTDEEAKEFYDQNQALFAPKFEVKASHILVGTLDMAEDIKKQLDDGGVFADLAKQHSTCPSKDIGGDLGFFSKGMMVPEFEAAALNLDQDEVSEPVQTQFGFHIIKKTDHRESKPTEFSEVKAAISENLKYAKQNAVFMAKVEEFEKKYKVERL